MYKRGNIGARGRNRTGTVLPPRDFKSLASTNFATRAKCHAAKFYSGLTDK
jgi:hypothetical protein